MSDRFFLVLTLQSYAHGVASTPFLARLFATLLPHSLAHRNQPFLQARHNIVHTLRFAAKRSGGPQVYIRFLFANSQRLESRASQAASHARHAWAF